MTVDSEFTHSQQATYEISSPTMRSHQNTANHLPRVLICVIACIGCKDQAAHTQVAWNTTRVESAIDLLSDTSGELVKEDWFIHRLDEHKIGHRWVREYKVDKGHNRGTRRLVIDKLAIPRFNHVVHQTLRTVTLSDENGVRKLAYEVESGTKQRFAAQVIGSKLRMKRIGGASTDFDWSKSILGYDGIEVAVTTNPLEPGETRIVSTLQAINDNVVTYELQAGDWQENKQIAVHGGHTAELMPITAKPRGGSELSETLTYWLNREAILVRRESTFLKQSLERCTDLQALTINDVVEFDLALKASVPISPPLPSPEEIRSARYRVTCHDVNPAKLFPSCSYQAVTPIDEHSVEITVASKTTPPTPDLRRPTAADVGSNRWLQTHHESILSFAETAAGKEVEPKETAFAIRDYVYGFLDKSESDQVLASALVAATERKGDCTEHAMLVASACRARNIPARVAIGLIYDEPSSSMVYHMWAEVWTNNRWLPIDATRPHPHFTATRLKMSDENLDHTSDFGIVAPVVRAAGRLEIAFLGVE